MTNAHTLMTVKCYGNIWEIFVHFITNSNNFVFLLILRIFFPFLTAFSVASTVNEKYWHI